MEKYCQSCGMPMSKDPEHGGTEKDGSRSGMFCSYCYKNGEFTSSEITNGKEMQQLCMKILREKGFNRVFAWLFTRGIPRLKRWKNMNDID